MNKNKIILTLAALAVLSVSKLSFSMSILKVIKSVETEEEKISKIDKLIKEKKININEIVKFSNFDTPHGTPLIKAVRYSYPLIVKFLLEQGANANMIYSDHIKVHYVPFGEGEEDVRETALHIACRKGNPEIVKLLLPYCTANTINMADLDGKTPLYIACEGGDLENVKLLLPHCTSRTISLPNRKYPYLGTPLFAACSKACNFYELHGDVRFPRKEEDRLIDLEIVKSLLRYGAKVDKMSLDEAKNKDDTVSSSLLRYLTLAQDYDKSKNKTQFLDNLWRERDYYRTKKSKTPNKYDLEDAYLEDAYNILAYRSFVIKPPKIMKEGQTLFSEKTPEEMEKLFRFADMPIRIGTDTPEKVEPSKETIKGRVMTKPGEVGPKGGKKRFKPLAPTSSKESKTKVVTKTEKKAPVKKTESQLRFEQARAQFEKKRCSKN